MRFGCAWPDVAGTVHDVAVDDAKIEIAVVVVVEEDRAEADVGQRRSADSARKRHVLEQPLAEISKERMRFELVIRHDEIQVAVTVVVAEVGAHACPRHPVAGHRDARRQGHFREAAAALVVIQEVRRRVVGHEQVHPSVVVIVAEDSPEPVAAVIVDTRLPADVGKSSIAVVAVENASQRGEGERMAVDAEPFRRLAAEDVVVDPRVDVVDDEQVDVPVAIDIGKRAAGTEYGSGSDAAFCVTSVKSCRRCCGTAYSVPRR